VSATVTSTTTSTTTTRTAAGVGVRSHSLALYITTTTTTTPQKTTHRPFPSFGRYEDIADARVADRNLEFLEGEC